MTTEVSREEDVMPLVILLVLLGLSGTVHAEDPAGAFPKFCDEWMQKLQARQERNVQNIKWEQNANGVKGDYVGYTPEHTCTTKTGTASVPVGKITYREVVYEKQGGSIADAENNPARPVDTTEITEIFRYSNGKWIY